MEKKPKFGKIAAVVLITVLIWVWADLAITEKLTVSSATITIAKSASPNLWASFENNPSISLKTLVFEGPASKVADAKRKLNEGVVSFTFFLDPQQQGLAKTGIYTINPLDIIRGSDLLKQLELTAISCKPDQITVNIVELTKKLVAVKCFDEEQNFIKDAVIDPPQVDAYVPPAWSGEKLMAKVVLTRREISSARLAPIERRPYIELAPGQTREIPTTVKITTPPEEDLLRPETIKNTTLGFTLSALLQGKFKVEVTNLSEVLSPIAIRATPEAKRAYETMRFQVILEIDDSDKDNKSAEPLRRELIYNFPDEFVRKNEIVLNQQPVIARFKLIPITSAPPAQPPAE